MCRDKFVDLWWQDFEPGGNYFTLASKIKKQPFARGEKLVTSQEKKHTKFKFPTMDFFIKVKDNAKNKPNRQFIAASIFFQYKTYGGKIVYC